MNVIAADTHKRSHTVGAVDAAAGAVTGGRRRPHRHPRRRGAGPRGRLLAARTFPTTPDGNRELLPWLASFGPIAVIGVESPGSYAAGLVRHLRSRDIPVVEVNPPHAHTRRRRGKSDP